VKKISDLQFDLVKLKVMQIIKALDVESGGKKSLSVQVDGWSHKGVDFFGINISFVSLKDDKVQVCDVVLDFRRFPFNSHTAVNIKEWFLETLKEHVISLSMISMVTLDGAANGQAAMNLIGELTGLVNTCYAHQLQRGVLMALKAGGEEVTAVVEKQNRISQFFNQSNKANEFLREEQRAAGVEEDELLTTMTSSKTRWNGFYQGLRRNNLLRTFIEKVLLKRVQPGMKGFVTGMTLVQGTGGEQVMKPLEHGDLHATPHHWRVAAELETALQAASEATTLIETSSTVSGLGATLTPDQVVYALWDVRRAADKTTIWVPGPRECGASRQRKLYEINSLAWNEGVSIVRKTLSKEIDDRIFNNSKQPMCWGVLISLVMSKQLRHKGQGSVEVLGATLHSEARTAYKKALYQVHKDGQWGCKGLGGSSPPSSKKRRMMGTGSDDEGSTEGGGSAEGAVRLDPVEMEMDAWAR
jgi:hypothetical protein